MIFLGIMMFNRVGSVILVIWVFETFFLKSILIILLEKKTGLAFVQTNLRIYLSTT